MTKLNHKKKEVRTCTSISYSGAGSYDFSALLSSFLQQMQTQNQEMGILIGRDKELANSFEQAGGYVFTYCSEMVMQNSCVSNLICANLNYKWQLRSIIFLASCKSCKSECCTFFLHCIYKSCPNHHNLYITILIICYKLTSTYLLLLW